MIESSPRSKTILILSLLLGMATLAVYWQVQDHEFINHDDPVYITQNPHVQNGLTWESVKWAFTTHYANFWHPLTWLSIMLDCQLFGMDAGMHHWMAVIIHLIGTLLLFYSLTLMTGAPARSAMVAGLFALHPLHVESVAWAAERKDVLSTMFLMAMLSVYAWHAVRRTPVNYLGVLGVFLLGLMAKPMLVTVPFVLLLLDYWPLGRMQFAWVNWRPQKIPSLPLRSLVIEKIPMFVLSVAFSVIAYLVQKDEAVVSFKLIPMPHRILNAFIVYVGYIKKTFLPVDLIVRYPYHRVSMPESLVCCAILVSVTIATILVIRSRPWWFVGWCWYLGVLVPVIGLIQIGGVSCADRFTYVPLVGLFIALVWGVVDILRPYCGPVILCGLGISVLAAFSARTMDQLCYWHDDVALYKHTLSVASFNPLIYNNLAVSLLEGGQLPEAEVQCRLAVTLFPRYADAHYNLGNIYMAEKKLAEAEKEYRLALRLMPDSFQTHNNLANDLHQEKKPAEAEKEYLKAIEINPDFAELHRNYSVLLCDLERYPEAVLQFREYFRLDPEPYAEFLLAKGLESAGQPAEAAVHYRNVLKTDPKSIGTHFELAATLTLLGQYADAMDHYREVLRLQPDHLGALRNLAWILATSSQPQLRNGEEAVKLALRACDLTHYKATDKLDALAAAYAEASRFDDAVKTAEAAIEIVRTGHQESAISKLTGHLEQFKAHKPLRD